VKALRELPRRGAADLTALVIGATGLVGGEVARLLRARGHRVRALVRDPARAPPLAAVGVELARGDLGQPESLGPALRDVDRVFLASALDPRQAELQGNLVAAAVRRGARRIVKLSGLATALDSPVSSGRWHARTEREIEASGLAWAFLRPPFFLQNLLRLGPAVARGVLPDSAGGGRIAGVDARDVAAVAVAALERDTLLGRALHTTGPAAFSYSDVARHLEALTGREVRVVDVPPDTLRSQLVAGGMPEWHADVLAEFATYFRAGGGAEVTGVVEAATGRSPLSLEAFLHEHAPPLVLGPRSSVRQRGS
jgi:uncharacterized protein YbjT (DUF2867 family)